MAGFRNGRLFSVSATVVLAALAFVVPTDRANALTLKLSDGGANTVVIPGAGGSVIFIGAVGIFDFNITGGLSSLPVPSMDLSSLSRSTGAGTLTISLTDTGFTGAGGLLSFMNSIGGTLPTAASLTVKTYFDATNTAFGTGTLLTTQSFGPIAFSGDLSAAVGPFAGLYSLTEIVTITFARAGNASFDSQLQATPIPAALPLFASGLGALGFAAYRRKRKTLAA